MEDTKRSFFALYWGQKVMKKNAEGLDFIVKPDDFIQSLSDDDTLFLELKSLSDMTDDDAINVFDILFAKIGTHKDKSKEFKIEFGKDWSNSLGVEVYGQLFPKGYVNMIDYLRKRGYLIPYMGYSVEMLLSMNWVKLK